jgi:hypothetical protein
LSLVNPFWTFTKQFRNFFDGEIRTGHINLYSSSSILFNSHASNHHTNLLIFTKINLIRR